MQKGSEVWSPSRCSCLLSCCTAFTCARTLINSSAAFTRTSQAAGGRVVSSAGTAAAVASAGYSRSGVGRDDHCRLTRTPRFESPSRSGESWPFSAALLIQVVCCASSPERSQMRKTGAIAGGSLAFLVRTGWQTPTQWCWCCWATASQLFTKIQNEEEDQQGARKADGRNQSARGATLARCVAHTAYN